MRTKHWVLYWWIWAILDYTLQSASNRNRWGPLSLNTAKSVALCIVASRLDYCNSLLFSYLTFNLDKLQRIHNLLARIVVNANWSVNAAKITRSLHWLPIRLRIHFKLALLAYKDRHSITVYIISTPLCRSILRTCVLITWYVNHALGEELTALRQEVKPFFQGITPSYGVITQSHELDDFQL